MPWPGLRLSLAGSKTEGLGGTISHHVIVTDMIRTMCTLLQADIEIGDHVLVPLLATVDVVMLLPLAGATVLSMETTAAEVPGAKEVEVEVEGASIVNAVLKINFVGVLVLWVKIKDYHLPVPKMLLMSPLCPLIISRVSLHANLLIYQPYTFFAYNCISS